MAEFKPGVVSDAVVLEIADKFVGFLLKGLHEVNPSLYYTLAWAAKEKPVIFKGVLVGGAATVGQVWTKTTRWIGIFQSEDNPVMEMVEDGLAKGPQAVERYFEKNVITLPADFVPPSDDDLEEYLKEHWGGFLAHAHEQITHSREWVDQYWDFSWYHGLMERLYQAVEAYVAPRRFQLEVDVTERRLVQESMLRQQRAKLAARLALHRK